MRYPWKPLNQQYTQLKTNFSLEKFYVHLSFPKKELIHKISYFSFMYNLVNDIIICQSFVCQSTIIWFSFFLLPKMKLLLKKISSFFTKCWSIQLRLCQFGPEHSGSVSIILEKVFKCIQSRLYNFFLTPQNETTSYINKTLSNHLVAMIYKRSN